VTDAELAHILADAIQGLDPAVPLVLLCHHPPLGTRTDWTWGQQHAGSQAVRAFIETVQPILCVTGHIHEAIGVDTIGPTQIVNPGPLWNGGYAYLELTDDAARIECRRLAGADDDLP
jgi:Icc-related predicted phosphoesterase